MASPSREVTSIAGGSARRALERRDLLTRWALILPAGLVLVGFMLLPMLLMALMSWLEPGSFGGVRWGHYTPEAYIKFLFDRNLDDSLSLNTDYLSIFSRSFGLASITMLITLLIGFPVSLYIALQTPRRRQWLIFLVTIPFWTNLLVRTYAWILLLRNGGLIESGLKQMGLLQGSLDLLYTPIAVQIGLVYAFLPFMVLPIYTSLEKLDWRLLEAAFDLYANRWKALWRVVLPLAAPGLIAGCILVFVPALGTYYIPELLGGAKSLMIGNLIQQQFGASRDWPFGAALSFALLALVLLFMLIYALRFRGKGSLL
ncbi:MAG: ABC transporter permease [Thermaceae bacterium]|nr:ABC transporter permease [Thermaceae bacterium]